MKWIAGVLLLSIFTDEYNLVRVEESVSQEGEFFVVGSDRFGIVAAAGRR